MDFFSLYFIYYLIIWLLINAYQKNKEVIY